RYGQKDTLRVNFLSNNDITGGNSGSPVLNANGELVGIAFDGNWESMIGDLYVNPALNRTISVDIRYVLWVIDEFANADHLIKEMVIKE
ncbi:MAG: S46 family peptidase, partial [Bacteroidia bacterium]